MNAAAPSKRLRRRRRRVHPLAIALITILVAVFVTFYAFNQGLPFVHSFTLHALVNNSVNLRSDSPVRIAGIDVGTVSAVSPYGTCRCTKVTFTVQSSGLPIHRDATIRVRSRLFLEGGYYVDLNPGTPSAPDLHDGGLIPLSQTTTPVQFYQVLSTFDLATRQSLSNLITTLNQGFSPRPGQPLSSGGAGGLKTAIPQLTPVLKDTAVITRALRGERPGDLERLLSSGSQVTSTLAGSSTQLADLVTNLNRVSSALAASDGALAQSVSGLDQTLKLAPTALSAIDHALPPLVNLANALAPSLKVAPPLIDALDGAVNQLGSVVAPGPRAQLLTSLNATFVQLPTILRYLATPFPITGQVSDCLRTHILPVFNSQVPDGQLSSGQPVWQDFVHFLPGVAGASASFDGNGPWTRTLVSAGTNTLELGNVTGIGQIVSTAPPGGTSLLGARPAWVGDLKSSDFRPDARCSTQRIPRLSSPVNPPDLHPGSDSAPSRATVAKARSEIAGRRAPR